MNIPFPLVASISGGRTSSLMAKYLKDHYEGDIIFIYANTGKEREETLEFINECDKRFDLNLIWVEYDYIKKSTFKVVNYQTASRNGEPFEKMIAKYGIPNKAFPHCTRELKQYTIHRYLRWVGLKKWNTAIGIRIDEQHRINWDSAKSKGYVYPLVTDLRVNKEYVRNWWDSQEFDLKLKDYEGNCDMCWKKSDRKLLTMIIENPTLINWWNEMEIKYGKEEFTFFRKNKSAIDLIEMAKSKFQMAKDEHETSKLQNNLFDYDLDIEYACFCKTD